MKILYFTKSSLFEHSVVRRRNGPSWSEQVLQSLAERHGIEFTFSKDGSLFTPEYLAQFDAYMFFTTGNLTTSGTDGQPPMTAAGKQALLDAIKSGKGFIGFHSATDTFHTDEEGKDATKGSRSWRYTHNRKKADPYVRMIGAEFIRHGVQQRAVARVADSRFPGMQNLGTAFDLHEEWYSLTDFSPDLHVLLVLETDAMRPPPEKAGSVSVNDYTPYHRPPFPVAWARMHGKGRVYYTALGHREDVWTTPVFQQMFLGAVDWVTGRVDADVRPNLKEVAPRAYELPPIPVETAALGVTPLDRLGSLGLPNGPGDTLR